jgi:hypothetical protein
MVARIMGAVVAQESAAKSRRVQRKMRENAGGPQHPWPRTRAARSTNLRRRRRIGPEGRPESCCYFKSSGPLRGPRQNSPLPL